MYVELYCYLAEQTNMILQLLDDFEAKLASFTPSALFLFKTSCFFLWENSPTLSSIQKPQSTKYGVTLVDVLCMFAMNLVLYVGEIDFAVADHDRQHSICLSQAQKG